MSVALWAHMFTQRVVAISAIVWLSSCVASAGGDVDRNLETAPVTLTEDTADAIRALRVANTLTAQVLVSGVGLSSGAARNIVTHRSGRDLKDGTADDRPFYTLAELGAIQDVGAARPDRLASYGRAHPELFGPTLHMAALPAALSDPDTAGMLAGMAADSSLMIDGDPSTMLPSEWELSALYAHHFAPDTAARLARTRSYVFSSDTRSGPFIDIVTLARTAFGEGA